MTNRRPHTYTSTFTLAARRTLRTFNQSNKAQKEACGICPHPVEGERTDEVYSRAGLSYSDAAWEAWRFRIEV